jgi:hypothetical protein
LELSSFPKKIKESFWDMKIQLEKIDFVNAIPSASGVLAG